MESKCARTRYECVAPGALRYLLFYLLIDGADNSSVPDPKVVLYSTLSENYNLHAIL